MFKTPAVIIAMLACSASAYADCKPERALNAQLKGGKSAVHKFFLTKPGAGLNVVTPRVSDKLTWKVTRPNGQNACSQKGPDSILSCAPTVDKQAWVGVYKILVKNPSRYPIKYEVSCFNAP